MQSVRFATVPFRFFHLTRFFAVTLFILATATRALSQSDRGAIAGTVLDST